VKRGFLCLPSEPQVRSVCLERDGLVAHARAGQTVVDMSTVPVALARELGAAFAAKRVAFADAPVARTAQAARDGTLSIMVGAEPALFAKLHPFLTEALAVARASGAVDPEVLFTTLTKGSADSFVLRNHGLKSLVPDRHPTEGAFPTTYIIKDLSYAIALAESAGLTLEQASTSRRLMERTAAAGYRDEYCGGRLRLIALVEDPAAIRSIPAALARAGADRGSPCVTGLDASRALTIGA
jgi:3-hydroxyisobutyrate dehydrogenase-like beta-hydroxyacid dehydrogenase